MKTENFAVTKIKAHAGNLHKQQQVGDNHIYNWNDHDTVHVCKYMLENNIPSTYDLQPTLEAALARLGWK